MTESPIPVTVGEWFTPFANARNIKPVDDKRLFEVDDMFPLLETPFVFIGMMGMITMFAENTLFLDAIKSKLYEGTHTPVGPVRIKYSVEDEKISVDEAASTVGVNFQISSLDQLESLKRFSFEMDILGKVYSGAIVDIEEEYEAQLSISMQEEGRVIGDSELSDQSGKLGKVYLPINLKNPSDSIETYRRIQIRFVPSTS